MTLKVSTRYCS